MSLFKAHIGTSFAIEPTEDLIQDITTAVATAEGIDTMDLPPLYEVVDPDALISLIGSYGQLDGTRSLEVTFEYHGYEVTVTGDGSVALAE